MFGLPFRRQKSGNSAKHSPFAFEPDPIFDHFPRWKGDVPAGYGANWLGILTSTNFRMAPNKSGAHNLKPPMPRQNEEYAEWVAVLTSVKEAGDARRTFRMVELGAGYGAWLGAAVGAMRRARYEIDYELVGVEAEPQHFKWMQEHLAYNGVPDDKMRLVEAAVTGERVPSVSFMVGNPRAWYGQSVALRDFEGIATVEVPAITLHDLLVPYWTVDLIHVDIQGTESEVLTAAEATFANKVHRVCVGTHSLENERGVRELFASLNWFCEDDYSLKGNRITRWGPSSFNDGVQVWRNPRTDIFPPK